MSDVLKSCPFCGGEAMPLAHPVQTASRLSGSPQFQVCCMECRSETNRWAAAEYAAAAWNRREPQDALLLEVGRLRGALEGIQKLRDGYASQAKFADIDCAVHFREFVRRVDVALSPGERKEGASGGRLPAHASASEAATPAPSNLDLVREFHAAFDIPSLSGPAFPSPERVDLRLRILDEERNELGDAIIARDLVEVADALTDMAYLVYGTALEFGIDLNPCFREVHRSNMSKLGLDGKPILRLDGKVLKGPNYSPPSLAPLLSTRTEAPADAAPQARKSEGDGA